MNRAKKKEKSQSSKRTASTELLYYCIIGKDYTKQREGKPNPFLKGLFSLLLGKSIPPWSQVWISGLQQNTEKFCCTSTKGLPKSDPRYYFVCFMARFLSSAVAVALAALMPIIWNIENVTADSSCVVKQWCSTWQWQYSNSYHCETASSAESGHVVMHFCQTDISCQ